MEANHEMSISRFASIYTVYYTTTISRGNKNY